MAEMVVTSTGRLRRASQVAWEQRHAEERAAVAAAYYATHKEKHLAEAARRREEKREEYRVRDQAYYEANKERIKAQVKANRLADPEAHKAARRRRRASLRGVQSEAYTLQEIWERDEGICGICGFAVSLELDRNDAMGATIDHIVPLNPGHDLKSNVRVAHRSCNSRKSRREEVI
jgi:5-methylcytosine-specific restriction endonuclease McrA